MSFFTSSKEPLLGSASSASSASPGDSVIPFLEIDTPEFQAAVINGVNELKRNMGVDTIDDMDFNFILKYLKRYNEISDIFKRRRDIPDEYINGLILSILDQINFYRNGCAIIQLRPLENKVSTLSGELNPPTRVEDVPLSTVGTITKNVKDVAKKTSPEYWSKKKEYQKYRNELTELQELHAQLSKESFSTKNFLYSQRISNVIQKLRTKYGSVDGIFCGEARLSMGTEVVFQLNIITSRNGGDDLKLSFTSQEVSLEDEVNIMNELVNYISEGEAEAPLLRSNNVRITNLMPKPSGCLQCGKCIMLGGAKKIKRTKQSKKRNVRLLKSKSKKTRRKNKMRRSQNNKK
jgi:hypothetical protein